jgi:hypothetical protein
MDIFDEELLKLFKILSFTRYIIVGDFASNLHAKTSFTPIIEIWVDYKSESFSDFLKKLKNVYQINNFILENEANNQIELQIDGFFNVHFLIIVKGLENIQFDSAYKLASIADIEGVKVPFLHINQLIISKKAANRPKDQIDVMALEKIKKLREEEQ